MEYLPGTTLNWCRYALRGANIEHGLVNADTMDTNQVKLHQHAYLTLQTLIQQYHQAQPHLHPLQHLPKPTGGYEYVEARSYVMKAIILENAESTARPRGSCEGEEVYVFPEELVDYRDNIFYEVEDDAMLLPVDD